MADIIKDKLIPRIVYLLSRVAFFVPLFAAYLVYPAQDPGGAFFTQFVELQFVFVSTVLSWGVLRQLVIVRTSDSYSTYSRFGRITCTCLILATMMWLLASLTGFQSRSSSDLFLYMLAAMTLGGFAELLERKNKSAPSRGLFFLYFWAICYMSFLIRLGQHTWQPLLFCIGPAAACLLIRLSTQIPTPEPVAAQDDESDSETIRRKPTPIMILIAMLSMMAPFCPALLAYSNQLSLKYLIIFGILPILPSTMALFHSPVASEEFQQKIQLRLQLMGVLYMALLIVSRLL